MFFCPLLVKSKSIVLYGVYKEGLGLLRSIIISEIWEEAMLHTTSKVNKAHASLPVIGLDFNVPCSYAASCFAP